MITLDLFEKKLNQLHKRHVSKTKDLETAMHSQGIDPGEPKKDGHHVQYPKASFKRTGKPAHGITAVEDGHGKLTSNTGAHTVRDAVLASGRVDKRPEAKAKRKAEAAENKAAKKKQRDPFTREHTEWWVEMWRLDEGDAFKEIQRIDSNKPQQDIERKKREERKAAANKRVADIENKERAGAPERRERDQAAKDRAARNAAAQQRVADVEEREAVKKNMRTQSRTAPSVAPKKETETPKPAGQSKPMNTGASTAQPKKKYASADEIRDTKFQNYKADREERKKKDKEKEKAAGRKKTLDILKGAASAAGKVTKAATNMGERGDPTASSGASVQGTGKAKSWATK